MGTAVSIRSPQSPGHKLVPGHGLLGTRPHCRRWAMGVRAKLHLYFQSLPTACITAWAQPPVRSALESHRSTSPTVNCTCKGSILHSFMRIILKPTLCFTHSHPLGSMEKLSSMKPISGAKKFGASWYRHPLPSFLMPQRDISMCMFCVGSPSSHDRIEPPLPTGLMTFIDYLPTLPHSLLPLLVFTEIISK